MLQIMFQGHQSSGFGEKRFLNVFALYGHGGHTWSCDHDCLNKYSFPQHLEAQYGFGYI